MGARSKGRTLEQATVCRACTTSALTAQRSRLPRRRCERPKGTTTRRLCACAWLCGRGFGVGWYRRTPGWNQGLFPVWGPDKTTAEEIEMRTPKVESIKKLGIRPPRALLPAANPDTTV